MICTRGKEEREEKKEEKSEKKVKVVHFFGHIAKVKVRKSWDEVGTGERQSSASLIKRKQQEQS